jgi:nucleoside-diphosphate-sugar epimerase
VIIGTGMVASALKNISGWDDDILFSSGVSNSGNSDIKNFQRETDLVKYHLSKISSPVSFVYFSTISIYDPSRLNNFYIKHKLFIEDLIRQSNVNYLIIRLPNLVGFSNNPHTLTNYFADSIRLDRTIELNQSAIRHLIDVDDLPSILKDIKLKFGKNKVTIDVETDFPLSADQILHSLEKAMKKKAIIQIVKENADNNTEKIGLGIETMDYLWKTGNDYLLNLLEKYYSAR